MASPSEREINRATHRQFSFLPLHVSGSVIEPMRFALVQREENILYFRIVIARIFGKYLHWITDQFSGYTLKSKCTSGTCLLETVLNQDTYLGVNVTFG